MPWTFTEDVNAYAEQVWPLLASRPAENTVALTVIEQLRCGQRWSHEAMLFGWYSAGGKVAGAVSLTPPFELLLAVVPPAASDELVEALRARGAQVPGVNGDERAAKRFTDAWVAGTTLMARVWTLQRLYRLRAVCDPSGLPHGEPRVAGADDVDLVVQWFKAFHAELGSHEVDVGSTVRDRIESGLIWLWRDGDGRAVSLAGRRPAAAGTARVGPVFTPAQHRRCGYGKAVTAACTQDALRHGAEEVVLFADLANPTSNAIYQQIGYRPVADRSVIRFA